MTANRVVGSAAGGRRHAGDDAAVVAGDVVGDDRLVAEGQRYGPAGQFDDMDGLHVGDVSSSHSPAAQTCVCWCWVLADGDGRVWRSSGSSAP